MSYLIETWDKPNHQHIRQRHRDEHIRFLNDNQCLLLACGAKLDDDGADAGGGIYVVDLDSRAAAQQFIEKDPFFAAGLFDDIKITRWRKAYLDKKCYLSK